MDESVYEALIEASRRDGVHDLVVGAYIANESSSILLLQRAVNEFKANLYELPSGGIEDGESIYQALCREVREETSLRIEKVLRYVGNFDYINEVGRIARQLNFLATVESTDTVILSDEHQNWGWFSRDEADSELLDEPTKQQLARYFELFPGIMSPRGLLVAFEGIDATGKSTLAPMVTDILRRTYGLESAFVEEFPADYLGGYLSDLMAVDPLLRFHDSTPTPLTQTLVLIGAHVYKYETRLTQALDANEIVCVERYTASILAYQPVFLAPEMPHSLEALEAWISAVLGLVPPADLNVLLTAGSHTLAARIQARDEWDPENMVLLEEIAQRYRSIAAKSDNWATFDSGSDEPEETAQRIASFLVKQVIDRRSLEPGE